MPVVPKVNPKIVLRSPESPWKGAVIRLRRQLSRSSPLRNAILGLLAATALLYGIGLGNTDFWAPDEPRYGAIAEEMRSFRHGPSGLVLLHLNDAPYTQKPPLYFWIAAAFGSPIGRVGEIAARLPSAIAGLFCVGLTAWIGRCLFRQPLPAILAAGVLATSVRFAFTARRAQLDVLLTGFELAAIALFLLLEFRRGGVENARRFPLAIAGLHASLGAAALTKGPVGWLPLLIFAAYLAWDGRIRAFRAITPFWSLCLSVGPIGLWILSAIALAPAGFAEAALGDNLLGRFFAGTSHARPIWYFARQLPLDFMPWSLLLPFSLPALWHFAKPAARPAAHEAEHAPHQAARFLLVWMIVPLVFFSLSAGKRGLYLLPIFPALALTTIFVGGKATEMARLSRNAIRRFTLALALVATIEFALLNFALPRLHEEKSPRPIAEAAALYSDPKDKIGVYGMTPLEGAIAYYGGRKIASLREEIDLQDFVRDGGQLVILRRRHFESLAEALHLASVETFRSGRRSLVLAKRVDPIPGGKSKE